MFGLKVLAATVMLVAGQQRSAGTTRVAVVNIGAVSEHYQKTSDLEAVFERKRIKFNQQRDAITQRIETAKRSLREELKPGTPEFAERRKQLVMSQAELQWFTDSGGQRIEAGLAASLRDIYRDIQQVIAAMAEEKGLDLVLAVDQLPPDPPTTTAQARQQIVLQKVIYWNSRTDLTDEVVTRLNAKYEASKSAGSTGAAPPFAADGLSHSPASSAHAP